MNDAACSWRTSTYWIDDRSRASTNRMFSSPGIPKTTATPSRSRQHTSRSATPGSWATIRAYVRLPAQPQMASTLNPERPLGEVIRAGHEVRVEHAMGDSRQVDGLVRQHLA